MDRDTGRSVHKFLTLPRYSHLDYWGSRISEDIMKSIKKIYFINYEKNPNFLNQSEEYFNEDTFIVLFMSDKNYEKMKTLFRMSNTFGTCNTEIVRLNNSGRLELISFADCNQENGCSLPIIIEILQMTSWNINNMYVISDGEKLIKSAKFIFEILFKIDVRFNAPNIGEPENTNFVFHNRMASTFTEFINRVIRKSLASQCVFVDQDNVGLTRSEIDEISLNNVVIMCQNHRTMAGNTPVRLSRSTVPDIDPKCMEISNPVVKDCSDILIILLIKHLDSILPSEISFVIRSRDTIFLQAKKYICKDSQRQIHLPDLET